MDTNVEEQKPRALGAKTTRVGYQHIGRRNPRRRGPASWHSPYGAHRGDLTACAGLPLRRPEGGGVRSAGADRAFVRDEAPSPTPPYPGRVGCCENTGRWPGPLGVKGP